MSRTIASHIALQTTAQSVPATPAWFGEVIVIAHHLTRQGVLAAIAEQVHFARRRLGHYFVFQIKSSSSATSLRNAWATGGIQRQRLIRIVAPAFACAIILAGVAMFVGPVIGNLPPVPPDALQVSAVAADTGRTLARREITNPHTVADLYARINALPSTGGIHFSCLPTSPDLVRYSFSFTRWGIPVEDANPMASGCYPRRWIVSRYGRWDTHMDLTGEKTPAILSEAQLPPLPSRP